MTPPETVKSKATLTAEILRAMNGVSQELDMFDMEVAFQRAMEEYATATLELDEGEELLLHRVTWDEKHVFDLLAVSEVAAVQRAVAHRPECATRLDSDNYQVEVLEEDRNA